MTCKSMARNVLIALVHFFALTTSDEVVRVLVKLQRVNYLIVKLWHDGNSVTCSCRSASFK